VNILEHYKKLFHFSFKRYEGNNYRQMREYFADVLISEIEEFMSLKDKKMLDVGGAKGEFCRILNKKRNCSAVNLDPEPQDFIWDNTIKGFADNMPFPENEFDIVVSRGVIEHIPLEKQQDSVNEMYRVLKPGGICYIMIPPWYNPHAGHGLKPFHYFPFKTAKFLRELFFRKKVKENSFEEKTLYPVTFRKMQRMILSSGFNIIATRDTHFRMHFLTRIPVLREILIPSAVFILTKDAEALKDSCIRKD